MLGVKGGAKSVPSGASVFSDYFILVREVRGSR